MNGTRWTIVMILSMFLLCGSVLAQPGKMHSRQGRGPDILHLTDELKLTDEQIEQIENLHYESEKKSIDVRANLEKERLELHRLVDADNPDRKAIISQVEKINGIEGRLKIIQIEHKLDVADVLNEQQRTRLKELRRERPLRDERMKSPKGKMHMKNTTQP